MFSEEDIYDYDFSFLNQHPVQEEQNGLAEDDFQNFSAFLPSIDDSWQRNMRMSAKMLSVCASEIQDLYNIRQEKEALLSKISELNNINEALRDKLYELEMLRTAEESEKIKAIEKERDATAELNSIRDALTEAKIKAATVDVLKEKCMRLEVMCDSIKEENAVMAHKLREYDKISLDNLKKVEELVTQEPTGGHSSVSEVFLPEVKPSLNEGESALETEEEACSLTETILHIMRRVGDELLPVLEPIPESFKARISELSTKRNPVAIDDTKPNIHSTDITTSSSNRQTEALKDYSDTVNSDGLCSALFVPADFSKNPDRKGESVLTDMEKTDTEVYAYFPVKKEIDYNIECGSNNVEQTMDHKTETVSNVKIEGTTRIKDVKTKELPSLQIQEILSTLHKFEEEVGLVLEPISDSVLLTFSLEATQEVKPEIKVFESNEPTSLSSKEANKAVESGTVTKPQGSPPTMPVQVKVHRSREENIDNTVTEYIKTPLDKDCSSKSQVHMGRPLTTRKRKAALSAVTPVSRISNEKKCPEVQLTAVLEMNVDFDTITKKISNDDLLAIKNIPAKKFGEIMAQVAIRMPTGNMWFSVSSNYRSCKPTPISNKSEENLIFIAKELCAGNIGVWNQFIKQLWLFLVSNSNYDVSLCCRIMRYICSALSIEAQCEKLKYSDFVSTASQFLKDILTFIAFQYPTYLGQVLTFVVQQVPFELISFLNKADGYNIRAVLGLFSDAVTQDLFLWYWSSYFPSEVIVFDKGCTIEDLCNKMA